MESRFPTKAEVAAENQRRMGGLTGPTRTYKSHDTAGVNDRGEPVDIREARKLLNREMAPEVIKLKVRNVVAYGAITHRSPISQVGCQVMLIKVEYSPGDRLRIILQGNLLEPRAGGAGQRVPRQSRRLLYCT